MKPKIATAGVLACAICASVSMARAQNRGDCQGRSAETWSIQVAAPDEPGRRLVVQGRVLRDGEPVSGATILVFQTDAEGYYSPSGMDESNARLCGLMLTDSDGRYRFDTIMPAHYASGASPPAHVHYRVSGSGLKAQSFTLNFEGDPRLAVGQRDASGNSTWATVRPVEELEGAVLQVTRDLRMR